MRGGAEAWIRTFALMVLATVGVGAVRSRLAYVHEQVRETSEVYLLPPPQQLAAMSLGYKSALADILWAHVLTAQGFRMMEKRRFENLTRLYDAMNELDPTFRDPYLFADALITLQVGVTPREEVLKAREVMERGVKHRPLDGEIWLLLGQFVAYVAPGSYLTDPKEQEAWRIEGAKMLAKAAELSSSDPSLAWQAIGGASILRRAGERDAAIRFLERALAVTDDDALKEHIKQQLKLLVEDKLAADYQSRQEAFKALRAQDPPTVSRTMFLLLGPPFDTGMCAGGRHSESARCATNWHTWKQRLEGSNLP